MYFFPRWAGPWISAANVLARPGARSTRTRSNERTYKSNKILSYSNYSTAVDFCCGWISKRVVNRIGWRWEVALPGRDPSSSCQPLQPHYRNRAHWTHSQDVSSCFISYYAFTGWRLVCATEIRHTPEERCDDVRPRLESLVPCCRKKTWDEIKKC